MPANVKVGTSGGGLRAAGGSQSTFHNDNDSFKKIAANIYSAVARCNIVLTV